MAKVKFTILKTEFDESKDFCKANLMMPNVNQDQFVGAMVLWFAHQELWLESEVDSQKSKFGVVKYPKLSPTSECYEITTNIKLLTYRKTIDELKLSYPEILSSKEKSVTAFLAHLGFVFIKKAEKDEVDPGILVAARNISKIWEQKDEAY
ncbi:hypothetical protein [Lactobacillus sp. ESL0681]|uniref:hypothetical protein n=1 Tax=Lactobacillus sp. ESL0681 TaxID=2983211 RepID=UPI0023FA225A|nr:hypothetical protein [Lactobacillus sp. ESL0681]WEV41309.1 hypothetical protein OZX59_09270 [Lactobacillus sp. ESL0681]